jgi:RNA polymerase primary sigma factor
MKITPRITSKEDNSIEIYFNEISKYPVLTSQEELDLIIRYKEQNDQKAKEKIIKHNLKFVISVAKKYQTPQAKIPLIDLISAGNHGLITAIDKFDHTKGFKFISYAVWWIRHHLMEYIEKNGNQIRIPANILNSRKRINNLINDLLLQKQIEYNVNDLYTMELINDEELKGYKIYNDTIYPDSLNKTVNNTEEVCLLDVIPDEENIHNTLINEEENKFIIKKMIYKSNLNDKEIDILNSLFGLNGYEEINIYQLSDKYKMTTERIRQIKLILLSKLKHNYENNRI